MRTVNSVIGGVIQNVTILSPSSVGVRVLIDFSDNGAQQTQDRIQKLTGASTIVRDHNL